MTITRWLICASCLLLALSVGGVIGYQVQPTMVVFQGPAPRGDLTVITDDHGQWNCVYAADSARESRATEHDPLCGPRILNQLAQDAAVGHIPTSRELSARFEACP